MRELSGRGLIVLLTVVALTAACQPVDELSTTSATDGEASEPVAWGTDDLGDLRSAAGEAARDWDGDARLVKVSVRLDSDLAWEEATTTYVAPDADRLLVLIASEDGLAEEEPTLETLGFESPPAAAVDELPELPQDVIPPATAAERAMDPLDECDVSDDPRQVLYSNGAPGSWDGSAWVSEPTWVVSVTSEDGGVRLGVDGAVAEDPCYEVP